MPYRRLNDILTTIFREGVPISGISYLCLMNKWPLFFSYFAILLCCAHSFVAHAQKNKTKILKHTTEPKEGKVLLTDGTELRGGIVFNDNEGIVTVVNGNASRSFNSRRIVNFGFSDPASGRYRDFYSLEFEDPDTGMTDSYFFEMLKELKAFAVLARIDRIQTQERNGRFSTPATPLVYERSSKRMAQTETVYFLNSAGAFEPYMQIVEKEIDGSLLDIHEENTFYINSGLFKKYTGEHYDALRKFAKENRLSFKSKKHIVTILEEYERISGKL